MKKTEKIIKNIKKNYEIYALILILLFAFFLRVYNLGNSGLWIDESTSAVASRMITEKGLPYFDSGLLYSRAYFFHYLQAFFLLLGNNDFMARFPSVIFGLLTVVLAYFIGKEYSKSGGIICSLFTAVFYLEVFYSRQARFYQLFQLLFFSSLYFLYKSKENPKWLIAATLSFILCLDTQIAGIILAPFFIAHIFMYSKKYNRLFSIIPTAYLIKYFIPAKSLSAGSEASVNYASQYLDFTRNMYYLLILFVPGVIWSFMKKKRLTVLIFLPPLIMLAGIFTLQTFALRYAYFFAFPIVLYASLLPAFLYDRLGKHMIATILILLIFPSNLVYPYTYVNVIKPVDYNYNDYSAPTIDLKEIPDNIKQTLKEATVITYFSSTYEWYIGKPDYVLPFSMDGRGEDQISMINEQGERVDEYSGAPILTAIPDNPYYLVADAFSVSKLKPEQQALNNNLTEGCSIIYENPTVKIWECLGEDYARATRIIDGDTFEISTGEKVRMICIDAPEQGEEGHEEATQYLQELILNKIVRLEKDTSDKDAYGRLLRYVYLDGIFINKEMVEKGYAEIFRYGEDRKRCGEIEGKN